jgi:hypothetical protein
MIARWWRSHVSQQPGDVNLEEIFFRATSDAKSNRRLFPTR